MSSETREEIRARVASDKAQDAAAQAEYARKADAAHLAGPEPDPSPATLEVRARIARAKAARQATLDDNRRRIAAAAVPEETRLARNAAHEARSYRRFLELYPPVQRMSGDGTITKGDYAAACAFLAEFAPLKQIPISAAEVAQGAAPDARVIKWARAHAASFATYFATTRQQEESDDAGKV